MRIWRSARGNEGFAYARADIWPAGPGASGRAHRAGQSGRAHRDSPGAAALAGTRILWQEVIIPLTNANTGCGVIAGPSVGFGAVAADR
ncbi:MAG: hypothetical protein ACC631_03405 [Halocynthiibacter sp.]